MNNSITAIEGSTIAPLAANSAEVTSDLNINGSGSDGPRVIPPGGDTSDHVLAAVGGRKGVLNKFRQVMVGGKPLKMNGKSVFEQAAKSVINFHSDEFGHKLLCDSLTLNLGRACVYSCAFCYVAIIALKLIASILEAAHAEHSGVVVRIANPIEILRKQLLDAKGRRKFNDPNDTRVIYSSTLVDVAANMELMKETAEACLLILELTNWQIRLLSKSNLLPKLVEKIPEEYHQRLILGVSTGTLDDSLAKSFEIGCALPSKRLQSLHWLQDKGFRTFGMICPSLPQEDYDRFARDMADAIRVDRCEHVWAEVINVRGDSLAATVKALTQGGFQKEAQMLASVSGNANREAWLQYAWDTLCAHSKVIPKEKLRFLQY